MHIWGKISHFAEKLTWKWLRYLCRFWVVKIYFELTFRKIESKMKLLRGQGFFITSFIITASAVVSVSLTEYGLIDGLEGWSDVGDWCWRQFLLMARFRCWWPIFLLYPTSDTNQGFRDENRSDQDHQKIPNFGPGRTRTKKTRNFEMGASGFLLSTCCLVESDSRICTRKCLPERPMCIVKQAQ